MNQKYTSADTSINSKKRPAIYKLVSETITENETVLDYGCGKYFDNYNLPQNYHGYDPYNRPDKTKLNRRYNIALCSNVLNVIMEKEIRLDILYTLKGLADKIMITVYEGDKSGEGKETKDDCYQLNWRWKKYLPELIEVFGVNNVRYIHGHFECFA